MDIESLIIKLEREGKDKYPNYSISVFGSGKLIYNGFENVGVKGIVEETIEKEKAIELISNLKASGFYNINKSFNVDEYSNRAITTISLTFNDSEGNLKTKSISHFEDDESVPYSLKDFERKIDETAGSSKWINAPVEQKEVVKTPEPLKSKPIKNKININPKIVIGIVSILVVVCLVLLVVSSGFFGSTNNVDENENEDDSSDGIEYDPPKITFITPTINSERIGNEISPANTVFRQGDFVYIDHEFSNVTHNNSYNISEEVKVYTNQEVYFYDVFAYSYNDINDDLFYIIYNISTDESWPTDSKYNVTIKIIDYISNKEISAKTSFNLIEASASIPSVDIQASVMSGYAPLVVSFEAITENFTGSDLNYYWDFGDGQTSSEVNPTNTYSIEGNYPVLLTVSDETIIKSSSITIDVYEEFTEPLSVSISTDPDPAEGSSSPFTVHFYATVTGGTPPYAYAWDFRDQTESTEQNPSHTFSSSEIYSYYGVFVTVTDSEENTAIGYVPVILSN